MNYLSVAVMLGIGVLLFCDRVSKGIAVPSVTELFINLVFLVEIFMPTPPLSRRLGKHLDIPAVHSYLSRCDQSH